MSIVVHSRLIEAIELRKNHVLSSQPKHRLPLILTAFHWVVTEPLLGYKVREYGRSLKEHHEWLLQIYEDVRQGVRNVLQTLSGLLPQLPLVPQQANFKVDFPVDGLLWYDLRFCVQYLYGTYPLEATEVIESTQFHVNNHAIHRTLRTIVDQVGKHLDRHAAQQPVTQQPAWPAFLQLADLERRMVKAYESFEFHRQFSASGSFLQLHQLAALADRKTLVGPYATHQDENYPILQMLKLQPTSSNELEDEKTQAEILETYTNAFVMVMNDLRLYLSSNLSKFEVINRFKAKAMWYNKKHYHDIALNKTLKRLNAEDKLALLLAEYLFDAGYPVFVKAALDNHQFDLLGITEPLLVEAKIATDKYKPEYLLAGLSQLHAYMNTLSATPLNVEEAFFVVFRLSGDVYEFPNIVQTERFTIYPVVIDLGPAKVSGNQTPGTNVITDVQIKTRIAYYQSHPDVLVADLDVPEPEEPEPPAEQFSPPANAGSNEQQTSVEVKPPGQDQNS